MERKLSFSEIQVEGPEHKEESDLFIKDFIKDLPSSWDHANPSLVILYDESELELPGIRRGTQLGPKKFREHLLSCWLALPQKFIESKLAIFDSELNEKEKNYVRYLDSKNKQTFMQIGGDQTQIRRCMSQMDDPSTKAQTKDLKMIHISPNLLALLTIDKLRGPAHQILGVSSYSLTKDQSQKLDKLGVSWKLWDTEELFYKELEALLQADADSSLLIDFSASIIHGSLFPGTSHPCALGGITNSQEISRAFRLFGESSNVKGVFLSDYNPTIDSHRSGKLLNTLFFNFAEGLTSRKW
jgi:hypothetical protein